MNNSARTKWQKLLGGHAFSRKQPALSAVIRLTGYGADVELSNGRSASLWEFAIAEPIEAAATRWAEKHGASSITWKR